MAANQVENQLGISWHDSAWIPILNNENVLDYFCQRSNPFYDRTCNNEVVKMQRLDTSQLQYMVGVEYVLIHAQDPILFVIRKQNRHFPNQVTFLATYYILAGIVYQCPDIGSLLNSRLLSTVNTLESAFDEAFSYARYSPSKGYWWQFKDKSKNKTARKTSETSSTFQRLRVDFLLSDLLNRFPPKAIQPQPVTVKTEPVKDAKDVESQPLPDENSKPNDVKEPFDTKPTNLVGGNVRQMASKLANENRQDINPSGAASVADTKSLTPPSKKRKV